MSDSTPPPLECGLVTLAGVFYKYADDDKKLNKGKFMELITKGNFLC